MFNPLSILFASRKSVDQELKENPVPVAIALSSKARLLTTAEILKHYGDPGDPDNLVTITTPFPLRIAWEKSKKVNRVQVHKKIAPAFLKVLNDLLLHYGGEKIQSLGIDLFGGCFNNRPMRGLEKKYEAAIKAKNFALAYTYLSRHAWAIAFDFDPDRNALKMNWAQSNFSKPEYQAMISIFEKHGFINYGKLRNYDAMHFEIGVLL